MYVRTWTEEMVEKAREELNEDAERRKECLNDIADWASEKYQLKFRTGDLWLLNFARSCKFNSQKLAQRLTTYLDVKLSVPEMFANRDPLLPEIQEMLNKNAFLSFLTPDKDCLLLRWNVLESEKLKLTDVIKISSMIFDNYISESDTCMIAGQYTIVDLDGFSLGFLKQVTPTFLKSVFCHYFKAYPWRIKGLYFINTPRHLQGWYKFARLFMGAHLRSITNAYGTNFDELYTIIPQQYFPKEYGGNLGSIANIGGLLKNKLEDSRDWFLENPLNTINVNNNISSKNYINFNKFYDLFKKYEYES